MKHPRHAWLKPWKILSKTFIGRAILRNSVCYLLRHYIRLVMHSSSIECEIHPQAQAAMDGEHQAIFAFWHGRMLLMPQFRPSQRPMKVMISSHGDGEWISHVIRSFGIGTVRGSTRRGGREAAQAAFTALAEGNNLGITPDGPRGPAQVAQQGAVRIAARSGVPIYPVSISARRRSHANSWDAFLIPWPWTHLTLVVGAPIRCAPDADIAQHCQLLTHALNAADRLADQLAQGATADDDTRWLD